VLGGLLAAIFVVSGVVIARRALTSLAHAAISAEPRANPAPTPEHAALATASGEPVTPASPEATSRQGESIPLAEPLPPPEVAAVEAPAPSSAPNTATSGSAVAPSRPAPTPAELQAALVATPIVMYSTSWCSVCRKARQFLSENGLRYQEIDADLTPSGWEKVQQLSGQRGVPVIVVDGEVSAGLSPQRIMRGVAHSMERRLGVSGITFRAN
jgi:glutaredoxin